MLSALDDFGIDKNTGIIHEIYDSGDTPKDISRYVSIALPKMPCAKECLLNPTISRKKHVTKLIIQILMKKSAPQNWKEDKNSECSLQTLKKGYIIYA